MVSQQWQEKLSVLDETAVTKLRTKVMHAKKKTENFPLRARGNCVVVCRKAINWEEDAMEERPRKNMVELSFG